MTSPDHKQWHRPLSGSRRQTGRRPPTSSSTYRATNPFIALAVAGDRPLLRRSVDRHATLVKPFAKADGLAALENPNSPKVVLDAARARHSIFRVRSSLTCAASNARSGLRTIRSTSTSASMPSARRCCVPSRRCRSPRSKRPSRSTAPLARKRLQDRRGHHRRRRSASAFGDRKFAPRPQGRGRAEEFLSHHPEFIK